MLVKQQVVKEEDANENDENVNAGDTAEGDVSAAHREVPTVAEEPSIPSSTPPTPPPQPSQVIPSTSQGKEARVEKQGKSVEIKKVGSTQRIETSNETVMDKPLKKEEPKPLKNQAQIEQDEKYARELEAELNKNIDWDEAIDHVKKKAKEDPVMKKYQALKRKPQTKAQARKIMMLYLKNVTKEQIEEEESRALKRLNETLTEKTAIRKSWIRRYIHAQIWKNQRSINGPTKVKGWKLLESCGVQIITFTTTQLILLVERKYPLTRFTLDQMLNAVSLKVKEESKVYLELLSFGVDAAQGIQEKYAKCLILLLKDLVLLSQVDVVG
nr:hypothetical protein [Tanacetum cinerariifolium]